MAMQVQRWTSRARQVMPWAGVVTAALAVAVVGVLAEFRTALWLERFHRLAAVVYVLLFGFVLVASLLIIARRDGDRPQLRSALRTALGWTGLAALYTVPAGALDLPTGRGSVFVLAAVSAYVGTAVVIATASLATEVAGALED